MPHSIRNYYIGHAGTNTTSGTSGHSSGASNINNTSLPPRGYSSSFNTSYNTNPANLPSYNYTNRFMHRAAVAAAAASGNAGAPHPPPSTATASTNTGSWTSRVPQYPPLQYQYYGGNGGYSSTYHGGANSDRYNASYSHHSSSSSTQSKSVCRMDCRYCSAVVCLRGMKAMLLADTSVELYSTDHPPGSVQLIDKDYTTSNCKCKIRDVACKVCGNVIGYHITQPCQQCLKAPNNGHFWMFHTEGVVGQDRVNLDLPKLVQQLVGMSSSSSSISVLGGPTTSSASARPPMSSIPAGVRPPSATTRLTSISRQQPQPRNTLQNPGARVLTTSPSPTTPTTPTTPMPVTMSSNNTSTSGSSDSSNASNPTATRTPTGAHLPPYLNAALSSLSINQFLQPLRWEQLPHPDLDIDLDPNTMGGEPLFAAQWLEMVARTAEAVAANMSLALDQEDETERFVARMLEQEEQALQAQVNKNLSMTAASVGGEKEELDEEGEEEVVEEEIDLEQGRRSGELQENATTTTTMEELTDQVDEFGLASSPPPIPSIVTPSSPVLEFHGGEGGDVEVVFEIVETVVEDEKHDEADLALQQSQRMQESLPEILSAPGLDNSSRRHESLRSGLEPNSMSHGLHRHMLSGLTAADGPSDTLPAASFLTSAMIARDAASAAAADAEAAAHSLVFGRRPRRDYDMMCR
ncbi:Protein fam72a [Podila clonocystis]|nr:Protein fam72a [Podila clonocystis]